MVRAGKLAMAAVLWWLAAQAAAQTGAGHGLVTSAGVVESLDFASGTMVVSGYRYQVATGADVEIGGSYGAFTMLQPGMRIRFDYLLISSSERRVLLIQELPDHVDTGER